MRCIICYKYKKGGFNIKGHFIYTDCEQKYGIIKLNSE